MKKIALIVVLALVNSFVFSQEYAHFGEKISKNKSKSAEALKEADFKQDILKVEGEVESVCQAAGCWMKIKMTNGETMRVTFKDYGFFVPKDISGKKVIVSGVPARKETSVEMLKHYAEDTGKTKAEIAQITEGKIEYSLVAEGVMVEK